jgi:hypothetical protein
MQRTTIMAEDSLLRELREIARREGVSLATVIREGMEMRVRRTRPKPGFIGIIDRSDLSPDWAMSSIDAPFEPRSWR